MGQFSAAVVEAEPSAVVDAMFDELPTDRGHFGVGYFDHILRGLRRSPPDYLTDLLHSLNTSVEAPPELSGLARLVVVHV